MSARDADRLKQLIAAAKAATLMRERERAQLSHSTVTEVLKAADQIVPADLVVASVKEQAGEWIWNAEQARAIQLARTGKSFCLIGAAGTGKTTVLKAIMQILVAEDRVPVIDAATKYLQPGAPGIVLTSFTRRAVRNIRKAVSKDLAAHCLTYHKLLEYQPFYYEVEDPITEEVHTTMRFEPARNKFSRLPWTLKVWVTDESSMVSTELEEKKIEALPDPAAVQMIFLGDLHQLPPVYGQAILGFKLLDLPVVELTEIYRQAQGSPIIELAHKIKNGETIPVTVKQRISTEKGTVTIHPWKKALNDEDGLHTIQTFIKQLIHLPPAAMKEKYGIETGIFDPEEDVILCPQEKVHNRVFGTIELNRTVAQELGVKRGATVHEIIAGFNKLYLAIGDRLLVGREDAEIIDIQRNGKYWGKSVRPPSKDLDRWGNYAVPVAALEQVLSEKDLKEVDDYIDNLEMGEAKDDDRKREASHIVTVKFLDSDMEEPLSTAGELNGVQFAYALTVHKSQGSEWKRVFFFTHQSHASQWSRELLYTAVTRAREELYCILEPDRIGKLGTLSKAAKSPRVKGDTLAEKAEFFKGKRVELENKGAYHGQH